jgi:hypothetical protein
MTERFAHNMASFRTDEAIIRPSQPLVKGGGPAGRSSAWMTAYPSPTFSTSWFGVKSEAHPMTVEGCPTVRKCKTGSPAPALSYGRR